MHAPDVISGIQEPEFTPHVISDIQKHEFTPHVTSSIQDPSRGSMTLARTRQVAHPLVQNTYNHSRKSKLPVGSFGKRVIPVKQDSGRDTGRLESCHEWYDPFNRILPWPGMAYRPNGVHHPKRRQPHVRAGSLLGLSCSFQARYSRYK